MSPLAIAATIGLHVFYQAQMIDDGDYGATGGIKIGRDNRSTWRNSAPAPLHLAQIPHDLTQARTRTAAVEYIPLEKF
jgi:hypothetical protein